MENTIVCIHDYLSVKSQARMRSVSKFFKKYVVVKEYSFYKVFKHLKTDIDTVIKMLFDYDQNFIALDNEMEFFTPIKNHILGHKFKYFIQCTDYYWAIPEFEYSASEYTEEEYPLVERACDHVLEYTDYQPLQGLLIEMCMDQYT